MLSDLVKNPLKDAFLSTSQIDVVLLTLKRGRFLIDGSTSPLGHHSNSPPNSSLIDELCTFKAINKKSRKSFPI